MGKIPVFLLIFSVSFTFFSCGGKKTVKQNPYHIQQHEAEKAFEELDEEADKPVEQLKLPKLEDHKEKPIAKKEPEVVKRDIKIAKRETKTKYPLKNGYPVWVYNPNYDGYLGAVGIAKKTRGGYPQQKRTAIAIAQANIAKQIRLIVNAEVQTEKVNIDTKTLQYYKSKISSLSKQEAQVYLKNTKVMDEWIDPKTGDLYVWVVLEK
ncbi:LPP20 family lipoprotein [Persephonella sp.]